MEQLRQQIAQKIKLSRILGAANTLSDIENRKRERNIIANIKNLFRLRKEIDKSSIEDITNLFRLKKENETIKNKMIRDIKTLFEGEDNYHKSRRVGNFWNNNYIEYENNDEKTKNLSMKEYLNRI